ncbi:hypothetical protein A7982_12348 [Minicystis rosea]|nr:hypothetical protein A7982_12348 [Minicystis rosea]
MFARPGVRAKPTASPRGDRSPKRSARRPRRALVSRLAARQDPLVAPA